MLSTAHSDPFATDAESNARQSASLQNPALAKIERDFLRRLESIKQARAKTSRRIRWLGAFFLAAILTAKFFL